MFSSDHVLSSDFAWQGLQLWRFYNLQNWFPDRDSQYWAQGKFSCPLENTSLVSFRALLATNYEYQNHRSLMLTADVCIYTNWLLTVLHFSNIKFFSKFFSFLLRPNLVRNQLEVRVPPISVPWSELLKGLWRIAIIKLNPERTKYSVITNSSGPAIFVPYNRFSL